MKSPRSRLSAADPSDTDLDALRTRYETASTSADSMEFAPITLHKREPPKMERSRKILRATAIRNVHDAKHCLKVRFVYQRKHTKGTVPDGEEWDDLDRIRLSSLNPGQEIQVDLDSAQTAQLAEDLENLYRISSEGIVHGITEKIVLSSADAKALEQLESILKSSDKQRAAVLQVLSGLDPEALELAALKTRHARRTAALDTFAAQLEAKTWKEAKWDVFFRQNKWILGQGLTYQFLTEIQAQAHYGGKNLAGQGGQIGDHLMATAASTRFTVLVEVKTPQATLVEKNPYRNGVHKPGPEVSGGVSQLQVNCRKWGIAASTREEHSSLQRDQIYTVQPSGILIVGHTKSLESHDMKIGFELYRQGLHNPAIVTFDELFERAKYLVNQELAGADKEAEEK